MANRTSITDVERGTIARNDSTIPAPAQVSQPSRIRALVEIEDRENKALGFVHNEQHSKVDGIMRDIIVGLADGLTVPFALTAGISSLGSSKLVLLSGFAELFAGMISMGLGAWLAGVTEAEHYEIEMDREKEEVRVAPRREEFEIYLFAFKYNIPEEAARPFVDALIGTRENWIKFMMDNELNLQKPGTWDALYSALAMGIAYFVGGLLPILPYIWFTNTIHGLFVSIGITAIMLFVFGFIKNFSFPYKSIKKINKTNEEICGEDGEPETYKKYEMPKLKDFKEQLRYAIWGLIQTLIVGSIAAGTSYGIVRGINGKLQYTPGA